MPGFSSAFHPLACTLGRWDTVASGAVPGDFCVPGLQKMERAPGSNLLKYRMESESKKVVLSIISSVGNGVKSAIPTLGPYSTKTMWKCSKVRSQDVYEGCVPYPGSRHE